MRVARTREELRRALAELRAEGSVALVPTMGFLHEGHLTLVDRALDAGGAAAVSLFVNPLQFGPGEDLARYPRDEDRDLALLEARGAGLVFVPSVDEMYPEGLPRVTVDPGPMADRLCGAFRPGHFRGVLTVVAKLLSLVRPDHAVFGAKDFQQAVLIRRMVQDLDLGVDVLIAPIVREADGLAMSSRNAYLSVEERAAAPALARGLRAAATAFDAGERRAGTLIGLVREQVQAHAGLTLQYVEVVDPDSLDPIDTVEPGAVVALAAFAGSTRLIDNTVVA